MTKPTLHITDVRMLQLMEYCIANRLRDTTTIKTWCENIGISSTNIFNIRKGLQQFTKEHLQQACAYYGISADYLFGFTNEMPRLKQTLSPLDRIKEAVRELETEPIIKRKRGITKIVTTFQK